LQPDLFFLTDRRYIRAHIFSLKKDADMLRRMFILLICLLTTPLLAQESTDEPDMDAPETFDMLVTLDNTLSAVADPLDDDLDALPEGDEVYFRLLHLAPDGLPFDMYINGEITDTMELAFPGVTDWVSIPAGTTAISVAPTGENLGHQDVIGPIELTAGGGDLVLIMVVGSIPEDGTARAQAIPENYALATDDMAYVTFFNGTEDAPGLSLTLDGEALITQLNYPGKAGNNDGADSFAIEAGTVALEIAITDTGETLFELDAFELAAGTAYLIATTGTLDEEDEYEPLLAIEALPLETVVGME
jgi:hypothetical protein